jgi:leucyl/phenylalanyl-tRNA---protein transferase
MHRLKGAINHPVPLSFEIIPTALLAASTTLDVLACARNDREDLSKAAYYSLISGMVGVVGTAGAGTLAYLRKKNRPLRRVAPRRDLWNAVLMASYLPSLRRREDYRAVEPVLLPSVLRAVLIALYGHFGAVKLSPEVLENAHRSGLLPMADRWGRVGLYRTNGRSVLELNSLHVEKNLARKIRKRVYEVRVNQDFEATIRGCANRPNTWINEKLIEAYTAFHREKKAHSVEAYQNGALVGGLYGVALGGVFVVESQFYRARDASKVCFVHLVNRLKERGYVLLDLQMQTGHLARFGAVEVPEEEYLARLYRALQIEASFV